VAVIVSPGASAFIKVSFPKSLNSGWKLPAKATEAIGVINRNRLKSINLRKKIISWLLVIIQTVL
jgi:hypothetical protein